MNWVDVSILVALTLSCLNGFRRGAVMQAFSWGGFIVGMMIAALIAPPLIHALGPNDRFARAITTVVAFLGLAFVIEALVAFGGSHVVKKIKGTRARKVDSIAGALVAGLLMLLTVWLVSLPAQRSDAVGPAIKESTFVRGMRAVLREPPDLLASLGGFLNATGFPEVFAQFNPSLAPGVEPAPASLRRDREVLRAADRTYKIESTGCDGRVDGSGFPVRDHTMITAAHVVAGTRDTMVIEPDGTSYGARVVFIDTDTDIAVLHVPTLPRRRLPLVADGAERGTEGAAIGYPGGGPRRISPARVRQRVEAIGYDIYNRDRVERDIYVLRASVRQGNSGGPFVDRDGRVRGMVFAASSRNREESYALAETEIQQALRRAGGRTGSVRTGRCAI